MELLRAEPRGQVRITCSHHFGNKRILPALIMFRRRSPSVRLHVAMNEANVDLVQQGIELAVRAGPLADSDSLRDGWSARRRCCVLRPPTCGACGTSLGGRAVVAPLGGVPAGPAVDPDQSGWAGCRASLDRRHCHGQRGSTACLRAGWRGHCTAAGLRRRTGVDIGRAGEGSTGSADGSARGLPRTREADRTQCSPAEGFPAVIPAGAHVGRRRVASRIAPA